MNKPPALFTWQICRADSTSALFTSARCDRATDESTALSSLTFVHKKLSLDRSCTAIPVTIVDMRGLLEATAWKQDGIFTRAQAIAGGLTSREFTTMTGATGPWVRVRYGVYAERRRWQGLDDPARAHLRALGALLMCADDAVLSHSSAAAPNGLPLVDVTDGLTHLTRDGQHQSSRTQAGVKHHVAALGPEQVLSGEWFAFTDPLRTVLDLSREFGYRTGLVAADAALRLGADNEQLLARADALSTEPHGPVFAAVAKAANGLSESPLETLGRTVLESMDITDLELQHRFDFDDGTFALGDMYSPEFDHLFECDGRLKYQDQYDDSGRLVLGTEILWKEKLRTDKVRGQGTGCSRIIWADTVPHNIERTRQRLWREIEQQHPGRLIRSRRLPSAYARLAWPSHQASK